MRGSQSERSENGLRLGHDGFERPNLPEARNGRMTTLTGRDHSLRVTASRLLKKKINGAQDFAMMLERAKYRFTHEEYDFLLDRISAAESYKEGDKLCNMCHYFQRPDQFQLKSRQMCVTCWALFYDSDIWRDVSLRNNRGITLAQYDQKFIDQSGQCLVCGRKEGTRGRKLKGGEIVFHLSVDHDHQTGQVRDLLCQNCNTAFGLLGENSETIQQLLDYSKKWKK